MNNYLISSNLAISDNGFLFMSSTGETFTVNEIGKHILNEMKNRTDIKKIREKILEEYEVSEQILEKDLNDFLSQLNTYKLVEEI